MGHVIVPYSGFGHASSETLISQEENPNMEISEARSTDGDMNDGANGFADVGREDTLQEPLLLAEMVKYHPAVVVARIHVPQR
jgi:hypothetical protein